MGRVSLHPEVENAYKAYNKAGGSKTITCGSPSKWVQQLSQRGCWGSRMGCNYIYENVKKVDTEAEH